MEQPDTGGLLTPRETEVIDLVRLGLSNADIAERLGLSIDGVKYHVSQIISKLGVRNRYEAAYWPEQPPWWKAAFMPLTNVLRRAIQSGSPAAARATIVLVVIGVAGSVGLLVFLLTRSNDDAPASVSAPYQTIAPTPAFLAEPARRDGDGWTFESRVSNLGELVLVALAAESPSGATLVDIHTGQVVAEGSFGRNLDIRLRERPPELLVLDVSPESKDRLFVFDLSAAAPRLAAAIELPERPGYKGNVTLADHLSPDGRYLFIPQRSWVTNDQCPNASGDGKLCTQWSIGVVTLDSKEVNSVPVPAQCYGLRLLDSGAPTPLVYCDGRWFAFAGREKLEPMAAPASASFIDLHNSAARIVREDGVVVDEDGTPIGEKLSPRGQEGTLQVTAGWPLDARRALLGFNPPPPNNTLYVDVAVADLATPRIESSLAMPEGTAGVVVLDPSRAVVLVRSDAGYELRLLDLDAMTWAGSVSVPDAPDGTLVLLR